VNESEREEIDASMTEDSEPIEPAMEPDEPVDAPGELNEDNLSPRDPLSIALVAGLAALLLLCVILVFVANRHRPAGL
jgi:hypothetical protein